MNVKDSDAASSQLGSFGKSGTRGRHEQPKDLKKTLRTLFSMTGRHTPALVLVAVLSALASAAPYLAPWLIGKIVDGIAAGSFPLRLFGLLAALYAGDLLVHILMQLTMARTGQRMVDGIRRALFASMERLPLRYFDRNRHGDLMSRLTNDVDNISTTVSASLTQLLMNLFSVAGMSVMMLYLNIPLALVTFGGVLVILVWTKAVTGITRRTYREQQALLGRLNGQIEESISGLAVLRAFGQEEANFEAFREMNRSYRDVAVRALTWSGLLNPITRAINNLVFVAVSILGGLMTLSGTISVGVLASFLLYARHCLRPFVDISGIYNEFQTAAAGVERVFEVMEEEKEPEDPPDAPEVHTFRGEVEFRDVSFSYVPGKPVLSHFSVRIPAGTRTAVVGKTGAGKTTLIQLLTRFYDPDSGQILLDGRDLREYRLRDVRHAFGVVLQDTALFSESVRYNLCYGKTDCPEEEMLRAARASGALSFISRLPEGADTVLNRQGQELSHGERQLLTIARAMLTDAPLLILDEATSSVDTVTEQNIRAAMLEASKGRTSFLIAHRLTTIRDSDLILFLEDGKIAEMGSHEELMKNGGRYAAMYLRQTGKD